MLSEKKEKKHQETQLGTMATCAKNQKDWFSCCCLLLVPKHVTETFNNSSTTPEVSAIGRGRNGLSGTTVIPWKKSRRVMLIYVVYWFILFVLFIAVFKLSCLLLCFISEGFAELHITTNSFSSYEWLNTIINYKSNWNGIITNALWGALFAFNFHFTNWNKVDCSDSISGSGFRIHLNCAMVPERWVVWCIVLCGLIC